VKTYTEVVEDYTTQTVRKLDLSATWTSQHLPTSQIEEAMALAVNVFENRQTAEEWLNQPNLATDNKPPVGWNGRKVIRWSLELGWHRPVLFTPGSDGCKA
jgi:hypothetical protein